MKLSTRFTSARQWRASVAQSVAFAATVWVAAAITSFEAMAAGLNDTGFTTCADAAGATVSCTAASAVPGQDARYGRDAAAGTSALTKVGGGANGFDFSKISNAGAVLPATAPLGTAAAEWGCTYDNTTGLMWEVKTATLGLRYWGNAYSWYSTNSATNGGGVGYSSAANGCYSSGRCDTEKFTQDVNAASMCGHGDWRMPTFRELHSLVRLGAYPTIDSGYFPNTRTDYYYWSGTPSASASGLAWLFRFGDGVGNLYGQNANWAVRLVRAGQ